MHKIEPRFANLRHTERLIAPMCPLVEGEGGRIHFTNDRLDLTLSVPGKGRSHQYIDKSVHDRLRGSSLVS